ncbi:DNA-J related domain-containing protein [Litoribacillus peritrichatus]|uniref:DNA-J related domain-containing protein n=1 Tax=Litoribacillus peritrichatus TaxID=718191 RepID=A0ABP7MYQ2_9GAMM
MTNSASASQQYSEYQSAFVTVSETIVQILESEPGGISLYDLIKRLSHPPHSLLDEQALREPVSLFQTNFVVMNALYQLQAQSTTHNYVISSLKIQQFSKSVRATQDMVIDDALAKYYLDWANFNQTEEDVNQLLNSFWETMLVMDFRDEDLSTLEIQGATTMKAIKKQYRNLSQQHHPDKGGDPEKFIQIQQAYDRLSTQRRYQ